MELTIGKFSSAVNTTIRTLRHYEQLELLVPGKRNEFNQKIYTRDELKRFYNIQLLKSLNLPLDEIKQRLEEPEYSFSDMLEVQEAMLLDKRDRINESLDMITRIKNLIHEAGDLTTEDLMLLMNSIRLEEDQRVILNQYFSANTVDTIMPKSKAQQSELDRLNRRLLSFFRAAIQNELTPESHEVQRELKELLERVPVVIDELSNSNQYLEQKLDIYKSLLPVDVVEFAGQAIQVFYKKGNE
ncbi:MerR family transcriptional regulator [Paenibacillus silagei]|uniref:DNA-binding transcriptional MerR regulator n=1 Tax=Paenibacillus silagei TaxID=1670801 RepID=A0ABS4NPR5_9BACL|nr:MerR family transcriptional regulator [Paenibacillus silagei]MBP2112057.1 DNA-binding transcriptional MerR regulator [Paenibacillus silagei]